MASLFPPLLFVARVLYKINIAHLTAQQDGRTEKRLRLVFREVDFSSMLLAFVCLKYFHLL